MNPLNSVKGAIISGFVIAIILAAVIAPGINIPALARWLHIISGVMWIGLLYYFNVVQIPALAVAAADTGGPGGAGISKYVAPRALWWFRWAAVATWLTGAWYLGPNIVGAFTLGLLEPTPTPYFMVIGVGAWLGTIMLINVWAVDLAEPEKSLGHRAGNGC